MVALNEFSMLLAISALSEHAPRMLRLNCGYPLAYHLKKLIADFFSKRLFGSDCCTH
jgi:hypothetical protein